MDLVINKVRLVDGRLVCIGVKNGQIAEISENPLVGQEVIDGKNNLVLPGLYNMHTHAAMTLFRGYGEDRKLMDWLMNYIWPAEAHLTEELVYLGTKLACYEMIRTGTICFMDMYWHLPGAFRAVEEMGLRAVLTAAIFDNFDEQAREKSQTECLALLEKYQGKNDRIKLGLGPHAVYTVSPELYQWCGQISEKYQIPVHTHLAETAHEEETCLKQFGARPVAHLQKLGLLNGRLFAAHGCWLNKEEMALLGERSVKVVTNPVSNLKLASGKICPVHDLRASGVEVLIGTDGVSSNNNLDLFEEMKYTAILQKHLNSDPVSLTAPEVLKMATEASAQALGFDGGRIEVGALADLIVVDLNQPAAYPATDLTSNAIYSLNGASVLTTICDGKVLMKDRVIPGEAALLDEVARVVPKLLNKSRD